MKRKRKWRISTRSMFGGDGMRKYLRDPHHPARAHAICRRLTGCTSHHGYYYGLFYWAALAIQPTPAIPRTPEDQEYRWHQSWCIESEGHMDERRREAAWRWALERVRAIMPEALALPNAMEW
ncbi:MAG: hypothetical protein ACOY3P_20295 [Planctomycetota bacterium]